MITAPSKGHGKGGTMPTEKSRLLQNLYLIFVFLASIQMLDVLEICSSRVAPEGWVLFKLVSKCFIVLCCIYKTYRLGDLVDTPPTQGSEEDRLKRARDRLEATLLKAHAEHKEKEQ
jgi:hypothetical protein